MLFNTFLYIYLFLPITVIVFYWVARKGNLSISKYALILASLLFYGYWNPKYLILIGCSMCFNYIAGCYLINSKKRIILAMSICVNLLLLGYYKYYNFFLENITDLFEFSWGFQEIVLPLAISFFTFQQIAFLVDSYRGEIESVSFCDYLLFILFFPQLIAGPIVHHKEMMSQFKSDVFGRFSYVNIAVGISFFSIGLFKKIVFADKAGRYASEVFLVVDTGNPLAAIDAFCGPIAYGMQLYFDFSGYADMAIGSAILFGIILPVNFNSPYKSLSLIEFWRSWHITLSSFLKNYIYFPLGGNRKGPQRRYINLMITMLLGGLWHGASWNFVIWGAIHGIGLIINHFFIKLSLKEKLKIPQRLYAFISLVLTFMFVTFAWVFFRAQSFDGAYLLLESLWNFENVPILLSSRMQVLLAILFFVALVLPNTQEIFRNYILKDNSNNNKWSIYRFSWKPHIISLAFIVLLNILSFYYILVNGYAEFLYRFF